MRAEAVRFRAFGNLTLVAATIIVHLLVVLTLSSPDRDLGVLHDAFGAVSLLLSSVNDYISASCMMIQYIAQKIYVSEA